MNKILSKIWSKISQKNITDSRVMAEISETREMATSSSRDIGESRLADYCPYCNSKDFVKRGTRKKKLEIVQLYLCRNCKRTFTAQFVKGKHYPTKLIIDAISIYNLGYGLEETCRLVNERYRLGQKGKVSDAQRSGNIGIGASTLNDWQKEYSGLCRYARLRPFATKMFKPEHTIETITLAHRQLYRYRFHRAKMALTLQEYKHRHFGPLKSYLEAVFTETPHQYFQDGRRMSEIKTKFSKAQMIVRAKKNYANQLAEFVLQAVKDNKQRHEALQKFMLANDSVTVATEVPVYIRGEDIGHMENELNFDIGEYENKAGQVLLTGHIDLIQVRNGQIHILDFKPNAAKERPIEQLTWYALALSRLTGLRLFEFKCAWFDGTDYFEFYPLHVVKKITHRIKNKKVFLKARGTSVEIPNEDLGRKVKIV
ncbi:MAG: hypothetical protein A3F50_00545 [Candidatus Yanofskybacteria bacterium RIFCSPHIGHO2_12_FULL_44_29b]|uniref:PD-(D/E)XK endonuclease-like domain-containing protein n=3 Tax=Patescibacteria group TaxID=1783273 RepID=A0A0G1LSB2_9BACT|nr:MAG: hypothetical protein UW22_C0030G0005 [Candidatus Gottesmanbacteria bacterium GW2011_GWB1_44_11c]KKT62644.1 MAG: hypothetical protein UW57_C0014G0003 [Candidatus Giovannonibacteria bacterium GW2011_GWA1_44_29]OGF75031.1 MAG: hypothetical protein A3B05_03085 [Candidatus Giovannonibacteria bacterium RIFCSPLOWO2_01_FULL_43_160]OGN15079.1 MAG: hypothetical protein A3C01_02225 [Candidatus Yanofskybacteria bacterium RIFCSPHIGHO2_02_FULL_44_36b]OGN19383.1 MAG: hypothetical protein A3F50_00545 [